MLKMKRPVVRRTSRTDPILVLEQRYDGDLHDSPAGYNKAFASALRRMADAIENTKDAFVDPEIVVWMHVPGRITAEVTLSKAN